MKLNLNIFIALAHARQERLSSYLTFLHQNLMDFQPSTLKKDKYDSVFCMMVGSLQEPHVTKLITISSKLTRTCKLYVLNSIKEYINGVITVIRYQMCMTNEINLICRSLFMITNTKR